MTKLYGLDLSKHNGVVDFQGIKNAGHDFVILRAGFGTSTKDEKFETYYSQAKAVGLKVGAYWYSYALNTTNAKQEAQKCLEVINGKKFEYPIYIDMEDADQYKQKNGMPSDKVLSNICETFCQILEDKRYYVGIYASESWFNNQLKNVDKSYDQWVANWGSNNGTLQSDKSSAYRMHQYTSQYLLNGKRYDKNICYEDYASIMKKKSLNGFQGTSPSLPTPPSSTVFNIGDKIRIKANAKDLNSKGLFADFVYKTTYQVIAYTKNRLIFGKQSNIVTGVILPSDALKITGTEDQNSYYPNCSQNQTSFVDGLKEIKVDSSMENRKKIALKNNISSYDGNASDNIKLLNLLKKGLLKK